MELEPGFNRLVFRSVQGYTFVMPEFKADGYYCDGGIIGVNKQAKAGTWAWCKVQNGSVIASASGIIVIKDHPYPDEVAGYAFEEPTGVPFIGNNLTELLAVVEALEHSQKIDYGLPVTFHSDNQNAVKRVTEGWACNGVPDWLMTRMEAVQTALTIEGVLLSGHPNKKQLELGIGPRGYPCSKHNVWCDSECKRLAKLFKDNQ